MVNVFIENRARWLVLSEVDYLGQFVKAWLAFNAWYRSAYALESDRLILEQIKWYPNTLSATIRPLLRLSSERAVQLKHEIGHLHRCLENYEIFTGKGDKKERIRLSRIIIRNEPPALHSRVDRGCRYTVERLAGSPVIVRIVIIRTAGEVFRFDQPAYDLTALEANADYLALTNHRRAICRAVYAAVNPRPFTDLLVGESEHIECSNYRFFCGEEVLFAGVLEALYLMRCSLFHGELVPTKEASACYEPAYRIIRHMLDGIN